MSQLNEYPALLKELQDQKHALDEAAIVAATDVKGRITYVNEKFCLISGYSREELLGKDHRLINSNIHDQSFFTDLWKTILSGKIWQGEICNRTKLGSLYWVSTTIVPFLDPKGAPYQFLSIRFDITQRKEAERMISEQNGKLVAASKLTALGELSAALTHEINNPLGVILGRTEMMTELLKRESPPLKQIQQMVDSIQLTAQRIEKIMKTVRSLAHGGEAEPLQNLKLHELVDMALDLVGARLRSKEVQLKVILHDSDIRLDCRPTEIFQILINLLSNASDAIANSNDKWIELKTEAVLENILISVTDSGEGVPESIQSKLFTPFFTTKQIGIGTGLGLTISYNLAIRNGAELYYDRASKNTKFCLKIPIHGPKTPLRS